MVISIYSNYTSHLYVFLPYDIYGVYIKYER